MGLSESSGLSLALQEGDHVSLLDGTLDISDQESVTLTDELALDLGDGSSGS